MTEQEQQYAEAFAQAIAEDVRAYPPGSSVVRVVVRWFQSDDPTWFAIHVLGAEDQAVVDPENAWHPLEWPNVAEEEERTERLGGHRSLIQSAEVLRVQYREDGSWPAGDPGPSPATVAAVRALSDALRDADVSLEPHFAASASHADGWGSLAVLQAVAAPEVLAALRSRDELPDG